MMVKVLVGNMTLIDTGIMVLGCSTLIRVFWVYGALVYEDKRKVCEGVEERKEEK